VTQNLVQDPKCPGFILVIKI